MPEINHSQFPEYLAKPETLRAMAVCLIQGEPMLVEQCTTPLIACLLNGISKDMGCEIVDGSAENIPDTLERINTYAMIPGPKIVWFKDAKLFETAGSQQRLLDQIQQARDSDDMDRAAKGFINLCAKLGLTIPASGQGQALPPDLQPLQSALGQDGVVQLIDHCQRRGWSAAASADYLQTLELAIEKGFAPQHHLVITCADKVPKNRKLYKSIQTHGLVVDCHVPLGERKADKMAQEAVLRQIWETGLQKAGKRMSPALFAQLIQLTGFDPATFRDNIDKLIDFAGQRVEITGADMQAVLKRTKSDPIYELTNAVADRNATSALFFLNTLLQSDYHPLQILSALANQLRKLLVAKNFTLSSHGRAWHPGIAYPQFQKAVMPGIQAFDAEVGQLALGWQTTLPEEDNAKEKRGAKKESIDLALAPNPANAYPVYQTILKSDNFGYEEIHQMMSQLSATDGRLKSTGQDAGVLMKNLVMTLCRKMPQRG